MTALEYMPLAVTIAETVVVAAMAIGWKYTGDWAVGGVPSSV